MNPGYEVVKRELPDLTHEELVELVMSIFALPYDGVQEAISKAVYTNSLIMDAILSHIQGGS